MTFFEKSTFANDFTEPDCFVDIRADTYIWSFSLSSVASLLTLLADIYPILAKQGAHYVSMHFSFMYWSVIGLYYAFVDELLSRISKMMQTQDGKPMTVFYEYVAIGTGLVTIFRCNLFYSSSTKMGKII